VKWRIEWRTVAAALSDVRDSRHVSDVRVNARMKPRCSACKRATVAEQQGRLSGYPWSEASAGSSRAAAAVADEGSCCRRRRGQLLPSQTSAARARWAGAHPQRQQAAGIPFPLRPHGPLHRPRSVLLYVCPHVPLLLGQHRQHCSEGVGPGSGAAAAAACASRIPATASSKGVGEAAAVRDCPCATIEMSLASPGSAPGR